MKIVSKEFREIFINCYAVLIIFVFYLLALILFIPTLGWSWRLLNILHYLINKVPGWQDDYRKD